LIEKFFIILFIGLFEREFFRAHLAVTGKALSTRSEIWIFLLLFGCSKTHRDLLEGQRRQLRLSENRPNLWPAHS